MAIKYMTLMADFETTVEPSDLRVWACCAVDIDSLKIAHLGTDLDGFMDYLSKGKNTKCYFHNLKFDGEFILYWLLTHGFTYKAKFDENGNRQTIEEKEFTCLIGDDGLFYSIEVVFGRPNAKKIEKVVFYDSLKKLPLKVAQIAKSFELKTSKGEIDYELARPKGWELTDEEKDYIIRDCEIVAEALKLQFAEGLTKMTTASDAMGSYKRILGKGDEKAGGAKFRRIFPEIPKHVDDEIRRAYRGGFVYLSPKYKNAQGMQGVTYDKNSMYPSMMYNKLLPYGLPHRFEGEPKPSKEYPLFIVHFKCTFDLKEGHLPTLQVKGGRFSETEYLTTSRIKIGKDRKKYEDDEPIELVLTSVDYQLLFDHYHVENVEYINGYEFHAITGLFKEYIDYWMHIKETTTGGKRQLAKLALNSLYGRFAQRTSGANKIPYLDTETGCVQYKFSDESIRPAVYTALACFVTAYSRDDIIRSAQKVYDRFIYADTDSLHIQGFEEPEGLDIHPTRLGAWKNEGRFVNSAYIRAKTYMESVIDNKKDTLKNYAKAMNIADSLARVWRENGKVVWIKTKVTCAGMPDNVKEKVTYENFKPGTTFSGKLVPRRYPGGIILTDSTFTLK